MLSYSNLYSASNEKPFSDQLYFANEYTTEIGVQLRIIIGNHSSCKLKNNRTRMRTRVKSKRTNYEYKSVSSFTLNEPQIQDNVLLCSSRISKWS